MTVVGEYEALVAAGLPPKAAERVLTGARHPGMRRSAAEVWEYGETRRDDVRYYSSDVGPWTGGTIWESGEVLARLLTTAATWRQRLRGAKVLELGCGTGLVGLAAAAMGAEVTLTDRVLACAEHNRDANLEPGERWRCQLQRLSWGDDEAAAALKAERGPFDFIFTSDTLYDSSSQEALASTVAELADGQTQVLLASPNHGEIFFPHAHVDHGFELTDLSEEPDVKGVIETVMAVKSDVCGEPVSRHPVSSPGNDATTC